MESWYTPQVLISRRASTNRWMKLGAHVSDETGAFPLPKLPSWAGNDFATGQTKNWSAWYGSEREARALARTKLGSDPVEIETGKWLSKDHRWQYQAKDGDLNDPNGRHIHLEQIDPDTGEVIQNIHLRW